MLRYPDTIYAYRIIDNAVGKGGSVLGLVHKAECDLGVVALKVPLVTEELDDAGEGGTLDIDHLRDFTGPVLAAFKNEAGIWKELSEKADTDPGLDGIVRLHAFGLEPYPWMALEWMPNGSLAERISAISFADALKMADRLLSTLHHVHHYGVNHLDLKPANVLFDRGENPKLTDWGLGQVLLNSQQPEAHTFRGTPQYSAPEQYYPRKFGKPDWRTDVYQAGAVIYHMLAGKPTVPAGMTEAMHYVVNGKITPLDEVNPRIPKGVSEAVMKALSVWKDDRWKDPELFRLALQGRRGGERATPPPGTVRKVKEPIGTGPDTSSRTPDRCPSCTNHITGSNRLLKCFGCTNQFCETCEGWFRSERQRGKRPLCEKCYEKEQKRQEEERRTEERRRLEEAARNPVAGKPWTSPAGIEFVPIPAGNFKMGSNQYNNEKTPHRVTLTKPFYLGKYQITQKEWKKVMGNNPSSFKGDDLPVENVSWDNCQEFIRKLNAMEGTNKYRLPTEAEWEYACRAGSSKKYCFGDDEMNLDQYCWYNLNSGKRQPKKGDYYGFNENDWVKNKWGGSTHLVGQKKPNAWGLHDMHGNVWEWCQDWYGDYPKGDVRDPTGPSSGSDRVIRGGGWSFNAGNCRSASRSGCAPGIRFSYLGFRLLRSL